MTHDSGLPRQCSDESLQSTGEFTGGARYTLVVDLGEKAEVLGVRGGTRKSFNNVAGHRHSRAPELGLSPEL
jgi:hypothetical protein